MDKIITGILDILKEQKENAERSRKVVPLGTRVPYVPEKEVVTNRIVAKYGEAKMNNMYESVQPVEPPPKVVEFLEIKGLLDVDLSDPELTSLIEST